MPHHTATLAIVGLLLAGGLLLLWVCWKMWRELRTSTRRARGHGGAGEYGLSTRTAPSPKAPRKTFAQAAWQIVIADVSMSLDNVLAVAGAARDHPTVLIYRPHLSIALMGLAATFIARLLHKHRWIAYVGLLIILYVSLDMIYRGAMEIWPHVAAAT